MRKACLFIAIVFATVGIANGAVRSTNSSTRNTQKTTVSRTTSDTKKITTRSNATKTVARTTTPRITSRSASPKRTNQTTTNARTGIINTARSATTPRQTNKQSAISTPARRSRAATTITPTQPSAIDANYNTCRDAYFTCMDQFCATADDTYRRCICSSKLPEIQKLEHALGQTSEQLTDFKNLNLDIINKTAEEVSAMLSATEGESAQSNTRDTSNSAKQLAGISEVLTNSKSKSLSTAGTLDIAGNIDSIWSTSDLAGGANIANLTGEALYNAVHAQCSEIVIDQCGNSATQAMVTTAYGMYIENDCSALYNALTTKQKSANKTIRQTEREMQLARLENYNAHNSTSINNCIAQVRTDITADTACGPDYVHCLDVTGIYLNHETGEPIYTQNFYQLEKLTSLSGDILTNQSNRLLVAELNRKRAYATRGLDTCRDIADSVWDEFLRQAISEIYQGQQKRVRQVKNECLEVVNKCYDEKNQSLKDFSNIKEQLLLGQRMELSEKLCQEKLDACSNLYGGGSNGLSELLIAMQSITDQTISNQCLATLRDYATELCAPAGHDTIHKYPYSCRTYTPGEAKYATIANCNQRTQDNNNESSLDTQQGNAGTLTYWSFPRIYLRCKEGYYLKNNLCYNCPEGASCEEGTNFQDISGQICGDYVGSLYHKIARYATEACIRPSMASQGLTATVLQDINMLMDEIHQAMSTELSQECERLGGEWVNTVWQAESREYTHSTRGDYRLKHFYDTTGANTKWGYCATTEEDKALITETQTTQTPKPYCEDISDGGTPCTFRDITSEEECKNKLGEWQDGKCGCSQGYDGQGCT